MVGHQSSLLFSSLARSTRFACDTYFMNVKRSFLLIPLCCVVLCWVAMSCVVLHEVHVLPATRTSCNVKRSFLLIPLCRVGLCRVGLSRVVLCGVVSCWGVWGCHVLCGLARSTRFASNTYFKNVKCFFANSLVSCCVMLGWVGLPCVVWSCTKYTFCPRHVLHERKTVFFANSFARST